MDASLRRVRPAGRQARDWFARTTKSSRSAVDSLTEGGGSPRASTTRVAEPAPFDGGRVQRDGERHRVGHPAPTTGIAMAAISHLSTTGHRITHIAPTQRGTVMGHRAFADRLGLVTCWSRACPPDWNHAHYACSRLAG
ncbi:hypothetical protein [Amycolatopsis sp.]|jgi:hypothetical protein|uniref:hypothetical protein n=1 Tax=Amycolatopsis sp. TaxID=37632 RepID=UPI002E16FA47